jgi:hypothetical protein
MKYVSALALLAALSICVPAYAQSTKATTSNATSVTVNADGTSVDAGANTSASASAGTDGSSMSASVSGGGDVSASASASASAGDTSSASSAMASTSSAAATSEDCSNGGRLQTGAIDSAALAAVTTVNVELVSNCSGLAPLDSGASAALAANSQVGPAVQAAGGAEIVGYDIDGTTLTVFAKKSS